MIGKTLGHYKVAERVGAGGMGAVYKARGLHLDRFAALRFLPGELSQDPNALAVYKKRNGGPYPPRTGELKGGRPTK